MALALDVDTLTESEDIFANWSFRGRETIAEGTRHWALLEEEDPLCLRDAGNLTIVGSADAGNLTLGTMSTELKCAKTAD